MQKALIDIAHQMACFLRGRANGLIITVEDYADFVHKPDLFVIVAGEIVVIDIGGPIGEGGCRCKIFANQASVYIWEEVYDIVPGHGGTL